MVEHSELTQLKLDLLRGMPGVYKQLIAHLNREGLVVRDLFDAKKRKKLDGILDDYCRKFIPA